MTDVIAEYIIANDNANDYSEKQVKDIYPKALEDIDELVSNSDERDEELWDQLDAPINDTTKDYDSIDRDDRGFDWSVGLSSVFAASTIQFFLSSRQNLIINPSAYRAQNMDRFNLSKRQLQAAGRRDAVYVSDDKYERLQDKFLKRFANIKSASNAELYNLLVEVRAMRPMDDHTMNSMSYVSRMTNYPSGSPQYKSAVADLVDTQSKRGLAGMNRRSVEGLSVIGEANGDLNTLMVWILDNTSNNCKYCPPRAGEVMTLAEWEEDGLPGADVCQGGDYCNCHLASF